MTAQGHNNQRMLRTCVCEKRLHASEQVCLTNLMSDLNMYGCINILQYYFCLVAAHRYISDQVVIITIDWMSP